MAAAAAAAAADAGGEKSPTTTTNDLVSILDPIEESVKRRRAARVFVVAEVPPSELPPNEVHTGCDDWRAMVTEEGKEWGPYKTAPPSKALQFLIETGKYQEEQLARLEKDRVSLQSFFDKPLRLYDREKLFGPMEEDTSSSIKGAFLACRRHSDLATLFLKVSEPIHEEYHAMSDEEIAKTIPDEKVESYIRLTLMRGFVFSLLYDVTTRIEDFIHKFVVVRKVKSKRATGSSAGGKVAKGSSTGAKVASGSTTGTTAAAGAKVAAGSTTGTTAAAGSTAGAKVAAGDEAFFSSSKKTARQTFQHLEAQKSWYDTEQSLRFAALHHVVRGTHVNAEHTERREWIFIMVEERQRWEFIQQKDANKTLHYLTKLLSFLRERVIAMDMDRRSLGKAFDVHLKLYGDLRNTGPGLVAVGDNENVSTEIRRVYLGCRFYGFVAHVLCEISEPIFLAQQMGLGNSDGTETDTAEMTGRLNQMRKLRYRSKWAVNDVDLRMSALPRLLDSDWESTTKLSALCTSVSPVRESTIQILEIFESMHSRDATTKLERDAMRSVLLRAAALVEKTEDVDTSKLSLSEEENCTAFLKADTSFVVPVLQKYLSGQLRYVRETDSIRRTLSKEYDPALRVYDDLKPLSLLESLQQSKAPIIMHNRLYFAIYYCVDIYEALCASMASIKAMASVKAGPDLARGARTEKSDDSAKIEQIFARVNSMTRWAWEVWENLQYRVTEGCTFYHSCARYRNYHFARLGAHTPNTIVQAADSTSSTEGK